MYPRAIQIVTAVAGIITTLYQLDSGPSLKEVFLSEDIENMPILVFSITGKTRGGKSFLLNTMIQYLEADGKEGWWTDGIHNAFDWKGGIESITKGLWIFPKIYKRTNIDGKKVGILLLDSQGLFDGEQSDGEAVVISGISTALSYIQMFNLKEKITSDDLLNIHTHLVDGMYKAELKSTNTKFMFIVRDFMGSEDLGSGLRNGQKYINIEKERGTREHKDKWQMLHNSFSEIECLLLPYPGSIIRTKDFKNSGTLSELDKEFISELDSFFRTLFAPKNLIPNIDTPTGKNIYDTLNVVDGREARDIQSFFHMFTEQGNEDKLEKLIDQFKGRMKLLESDMQSAHRVMTELEQTGTSLFQGKSAKDCSSRLTERMLEVFNNHVRHQIVTKYSGALGNTAVERNHKAQWSSIQKSLEDFVRGPNKGNIISEIIEKLAEKYYDRLGTQLSSDFKHQCGTDSCSINPEPFEECMDFETAGGSQNVLKPLWNEAKSNFNHEVRSHRQHIQNLIVIATRARDKNPLLKVLEIVADIPFKIIYNVMSSSPLLSSVFLGDNQNRHNSEEERSVPRLGRT